MRVIAREQTLFRNEEGKAFCHPCLFMQLLLEKVGEKYGLKITLPTLSIRER